MPHDHHAPPLASRKLRTENGKEFFIDLLKNNHGKFIKLTERVGHRRNTVLIPADAADDVAAGIREVIQEGGAS